MLTVMVGEQVTCGGAILSLIITRSVALATSAPHVN